MNELKAQNNSSQYQTNNYAEENEDNWEDHDQLVSAKALSSFLKSIFCAQVLWL